MMKRGVALDYVFCNLGGRAHQLETLHVMKVISDRWSYGTRPHFHAVDFDEITRDLQANVTPRYWQVILKRLMLRTAERIASERDVSAIVTGDAVGQVSSQTLQNLSVISSATSMPILRPLVGFNKDEIISRAREVGTHDLSAKVGEYCAMVPNKPATRASGGQIDHEETGLDPCLLERAVAERTVFDLRTLDLESLERPEIQISEIPENAVVLDLRSKAAFLGWHYPEALFLDFANALRAYPQLDRDRTYVLYCEFGLKSGHLAELMRRGGMQAWHFAGGFKALVDYAKSRGLTTPDR
jgi:thiamine biosynthesis protein ThiI